VQAMLTLFRRYWCTIVGLALTISIAIACSMPSCRYPVLGWLRHEPFYRGMPASYWKAKFLEFDAFWEKRLKELDPAGVTQSNWSEILETWKDKVAVSEAAKPECPAIEGPEAVPVLIAFFRDPDKRIRQRGEDGLSSSVSRLYYGCFRYCVILIPNAGPPLSECSFQWAMMHALQFRL
jgi:hypothetical protein